MLKLNLCILKIIYENIDSATIGMELILMNVI